MALVYLATLRGAGGFEKRLVVKQIRAELACDPAFVDRFVEEAKTAVELSHPNIVPVYELGVEQGVYYIAMELAEGVTLAELLADSGALNAEQGAYLGVEICRGLDYAHRRAGVVHRDVTPRNVLIDEEGAVRIIDFGIAAPAASGNSPGRHKVFGSPGHMPAEQIQGGRLTPATDVFAVGTLLIEAWSGRPPFRCATARESDRAIEVPPPPVSEIDERLAPLDAVVSAAVAYAQEDRPQSAEELGRALRDFLRGADAGDVARELGGRVRRARERQRSDAAGAAESTPRAVLTGSSSSRTFAAGERLIEWTRRMPSDPPPDGGVERTGPMPLASEQTPSADSDREPASVRPTTTSRRTVRRRGVWALAAVAAVAVVSAVIGHSDGGGVTSRQPELPSAEGPPQGAQAPVTSAKAPARAHPPREAPRADAGRADVERGRPSISAAVASPRRAGAPGAATSKPGDVPMGGSRADREIAGAILDLTSDLPARVSVDGRLLGATPVRDATQAPGRHRVRFVSSDLGETVEAGIELSKGATLGVHAEFTRATPAVRIR